MIPCSIVAYTYQAHHGTHWYYLISTLVEHSTDINDEFADMVFQLIVVQHRDI